MCIIIAFEHEPSLAGNATAGDQYAYRGSAVPNVLQRRLNEAHAAGVAALLLDLLDAAQVAQGCITGFLRGHPLGDVFLDQLSQVEAQLVSQLLLDSALTEQRPESKGKIVEPAHQPLLDLLDPSSADPAYSYLKATIGSTFVARRAGM